MLISLQSPEIAVFSTKSKKGVFFWKIQKKRYFLENPEKRGIYLKKIQKKGCFKKSEKILIFRKNKKGDIFRAVGENFKVF